jgi:hypothetical protein
MPQITPPGDALGRTYFGNDMPPEREYRQMIDRAERRAYEAMMNTPPAPGVFPDATTWKRAHVAEQTLEQAVAEEAAAWKNRKK